LEAFVELVKYVGDKWGTTGLVVLLWGLDRYRLEKIMEKSFERYIELSSTTAAALAKIQTVILERLPRNHDERD